MHESEKWVWSHSVVSDSLRPHGLQPTRLLHPWDFPGKSAGVGCHCLLQRGVEGMLVKSGEVPWVSVTLTTQAVAQPSPTRRLLPMCLSLNLASFEESWAIGESSPCLSSRSESGSSSHTQCSCKASMWLPCPLDILWQWEGHSAHSTRMEDAGCSYLRYHPAQQKGITGPPRVP